MPFMCLASQYLLQDAGLIFFQYAILCLDLLVIDCVEKLSSSENTPFILRSFISSLLISELSVS